MNTQNLLDQYFETAFSAPDGIKRLRELILSLAMQGKLVPQDPNDQPARELLQEIEAEKQRLIKAGKIKKQKPLPPIQPEEIPYELPESWEWVRLGDIGTWQSGSTPSRSNSSFYNGDIPWVKSGEVKQGRIFDTEEKITNEALEKCSLNLNPVGSVLIAMYGANIGEVGILEIEATTNQAICACQTFSKIDKIFLTKLLDSLKSNFVSQGAGAAQPNISRIKIINTIIPLPPLAEQKRIVEKIDRLMAQCDELEKRQQEREQKRILVHTSAVQKLLNAPEEKTFGEAWQFIKQNFGELYAVKENVSELRKAILQLAVMGKLVPQDPNDPPASELLKEITAEKQRLIKEGKIKKQKPLPKITTDEIPYNLPDSWKWVRLGDISIKIHYGYTASANHHLKDIRLLRITDIQDNQVNWNSVPGCEIKEKDIDQYLLEDNDILIARTGGTVGKTYLVQNIKVKSVFASYLIRIVLSKNLFVNCLKFFLESPLYWQQLYEKCSGTGQPNVNGTSLATLNLPLPPLAEQKRIVEKIDRLMALCDQLENQIDQQTAKQTQLLEAVMAGI